MKVMREREALEAARKLAKVHHENGTINAAGRALAEMRSAVAVLEAAEAQALHDDRCALLGDHVNDWTCDGVTVRCRRCGMAFVRQGPSMPEDERASGLQRARDHIARQLALATAGQGVLLKNDDAALLVELLGGAT